MRRYPEPQNFVYCRMTKIKVTKSWNSVPLSFLLKKRQMCTKQDIELVPISIKKKGWQLSLFTPPSEICHFFIQGLMRFCHAARKTKLLKADFKLKAQGTLRAYWGYRNGPPNWPCKANFWWPSRSPRWLKSFLDRSLDNEQKLFSFPCRDENCWQHRQHTSGTKQVKLRNQRDMVYLELLRIVVNAFINHQTRFLLPPFFIN